MEEMQIITKDGIVANRWPAVTHKEFGTKDRIYIKVGKDDQGYFDLKSGAFEQNDSWGVVDRANALVTLCSKSGREIYLGRVEPSSKVVSEGLTLL